jgi:DNA repair protein RecN (Recombination protein N)
MLCSLSIKNVAIIDELEIDFERGLNVMTGETGAGKTIIVQSLGLVLGARAQPDMIRTGADEAVVTATFSLKPNSPSARSVSALLAGSGIAADDGEVIVRRSIAGSGRGKIHLNGTPVTAQMLRSLACHLVDLSSQHEHQMLVDPANHAALIDDYGVSSGVREAYGKAYAAHEALKGEVDKLRSEEAAAKEKLDFLKYQRDELKAAELKPGELDELGEERNRMKHAVKLQVQASDVSAALHDSSGSLVEVLGSVAGRLQSMASIDQLLEPLSETVDRIQTELAELARDVKQYARGLNAEPGRLEEVEDRLHLLRGLLRKHGGTLDDVIAKMRAIEEEIALAENYDDILSEREAALAAAREALEKAGAVLARARKQAGEKLAAAVQEELKGLAMGKVRFEALFRETDFSSWDASGPERVEFVISPNIGEDPRPLAKTASGGELSRVMLAIKRALADTADLAATYVFDEVDSGIGGATAEVVGRKLLEVAGARQVICITHLPQVACFGETHFRIGKRARRGRTITDIAKLERSERIGEVARMLGGSRMTAITRTHAEELLDEAARRDN